LAHIFELLYLFISGHQFFVELGGKPLELILQGDKVFIGLHCGSFDFSLKHFNTLVLLFNVCLIVFFALINRVYHFLPEVCNYQLYLILINFRVKLLTHIVDISEISFLLDGTHKLLSDAFQIHVLFLDVFNDLSVHVFKLFADFTYFSHHFDHFLFNFITECSILLQCLTMLHSF